MSDDTPTERFSVPSTETSGEGPSSKTLLYVLIGVGALLVIVIVVLLISLLGRAAEPSAQPNPTATESISASPTPEVTETSPSPTPSASPEETEEPPPPPAKPVPGFDSFSAPAHAGCQAGDTQKQLTFSWSSDDAVTAYIGVQTNNAKAAPYESNLPPVFTYTNIYYNCDQASQFYTVTLEDGAGHVTHKTVTITK